MKTALEIVPARHSDVVALSKNLRLSDIKEIRAVTDLPLDKALSEQLLLPGEHLIALHKGVPIAYYGCTEGVGNCAHPFMLGSNDVMNFKTEIIRLSTDAIDRWLNEHEHLAQHILKTCPISIRWLTSLGFKITNTFNAGINNQHEFYLMELSKWQKQYF